MLDNNIMETYQKIYKQYRYQYLYDIVVNDYAKDSQNIDALYFLTKIYLKKGCSLYDKEKGETCLQYIMNQTNYPHAYYLYGKLYHSLQHIQLAAEYGSPAAMFVLSKTNKEYLEQSADLGYIKAINLLGYLYKKEGKHKDALVMYKKSYHLGNVVGAKRLYKAYQYGRGVPINKGLAINYYKIYKKLSKNIKQYPSLAGYD